MIQSIKARAIVKPGGFIEVHSDELPEGATIEVIMLIEPSQAERPESNESNPGTFSHFVGATKGKGSFSGVADIDAYIREERDSWDS